MEEDYESDINTGSIEGKRMRVQEINIEIRKLLQERDELEGEIEYESDDIESIE